MLALVLATAVRSVMRGFPKNISEQFESTAAGPGNHLLPPTGFKLVEI